MEISQIHALFLKCKSVSTDTRKIEEHSFFVALKGENFDANTFAATAIEKGASYVVIDNADYYIDHRTILVENSLVALQELAKYHRNYLKIPIIALTGSNGKTTTKELIHVVLSQKFNTKATLGNLNNHIGVPLTLLSFDSTTEIGIVEMGANHQQEIEFLCAIAQPNYGYITNFGKAHLEGFGGIEGVIKGKSEMYNYFFAKEGLVFVNLEDPIQVEKTSNLKKYTFGINKPNADVNITKVKADPFVTINSAVGQITSHLIGLYNANNINAAITIGNYFGVSNQEIQQAIASYVPENNRSQLLHKNTNEIILDAYNANPSSMTVAIENFIQLDKSNKIVILGDMFELGDESIAEHNNIIDLLSKENEIACYFVGKDFYQNKKEFSHFKFLETFDELSEVIKQNRPENKMILIKGSRGMALERILNFI
jgi:UDP-N-acetylmuramoyl-tripeptide--D-alanyl-D-alanine ligase